MHPIPLLHTAALVHLHMKNEQHAQKISLRKLDKRKEEGSFLSVSETDRSVVKLAPFSW